MQKKHLAQTVSIILTTLLFIVVGACFSAFIYQKEIIRVNDPNLILDSGILVYDKDGESQISKLELSTLKLGLKPATGEEDVETSIPSTVSENQGSEGQYCVFNVVAPSGASIFVSNVNIQSEESDETIEEQKENIMVAIKEIDESAVSLKGNKIKLGEIQSSENKQKLTFYIWLSARAGDELEASTISFDILIENL